MASNARRMDGVLLGTPGDGEKLGAPREPSLGFRRLRPRCGAARRRFRRAGEGEELCGLDRLPEPHRRHAGPEPRPGVRARPRVQGRGMVRRRGSAHPGTRSVFVFVFLSDTPPPSTSCGPSPGPLLPCRRGVRGARLLPHPAVPPPHVAVTS